jgi:hypothetical protein
MMKNSGIKQESFLLVGLFTVVWFATFGAAFVNGDDVVYISNYWELSDVFLPEFRESWLPNRVIDSYGRSLVTVSFDFFYFPIKAIFDTDFFLAYKYFSATLFAGFISIVYSYITKSACILKVNSSELHNDRAYRLVVGIFLAAMLITCLPWKNQVHLFAYQLPAFLSFVLLTELSKTVYRSWRVSGQNEPKKWQALSGFYPSSILLLAFVSAFSVEAYPAIMLISIISAWLLLVILWYREGKTDVFFRKENLGKLKLFSYGSLAAVVLCCF